MQHTTLATQLDEHGVLLLTLNRPDNLNSFTVEMANELEELFRSADNDDAVKAIVVTGAGRAFCAGMDLTVDGNVFGLDESLTPTMADMTERMDDPAIRNGVRDTGGRVTLAIHDCRKPVIAAINGAAVGIGATMTLAMDIRIASLDARIGFVFGRIGIVPEACSTWFLPRLVGQQTAIDWVLSADIINPETARTAGLLRSVHESREAMLAEAMSLARKYTEHRSPVAVAYAKQMMRRNSTYAHPVEAHRIESLAMFYTSIGDGKEGVAAFLEKRAPDFGDKASRWPFDPWGNTA